MKLFPRSTPRHADAGRPSEAETLPGVAPLRIVIPARDEATRIERTLGAYCTHFGPAARIMVVSNGCSDGTADLVRGLMRTYDNLELIEFGTSIGKGGAVRVGLAHGDEPYVAFVDADGSADAATLERVLERCRETDACGVIGSRWTRGALISRRQHVIRRIASRCFNFLTRAMFGLPFSDTQCGLKVFRRASIDPLLDRLELSNFAFDVDLLYALKLAGCRVLEEPIAWHDVPEGSKIRLLPAAVSMGLAILRLRLRRGPFRHLPFTDLLARNTTIPVKAGLTILLLASAKDDQRVDRCRRELERGGHRVIVAIAPRPWNGASSLGWYIRRGHGGVDAILDCTDDTPSLLGLLRFSTKPKVLVPVGDAGDEAAVRRLVRELTVGTRYPAIFRRVESRWIFGFNETDGETA